MTLAAGTKLGRYEIRAKIGEGGMGEVYLAQDTKLDRKVALKILLEDMASHQDRMRRFVQEAKAASALNHPNIITIYEIDEADSFHFIATEFIEGQTLRNQTGGSRLSVTDALEVGARAGLGHADGADQLAAREARQPALFLLLGAVVQHVVRAHAVHR